LFVSRHTYCELLLKISVITVTHNCASVVGNCLASVASQSHQDIEHVVIDGKSADGTLDVLQAHSSRLDVLVSEPDRGIYDALNKGIRHASGDVVGFLHADDVFASHDVLSEVAAIFATDSSVSAVYGDLQYVQRTATERVVRTWRSAPFSRHRLAWGWMPPHPTLYVRREWYDRIGGFDTRYRIAADYFSILQLFTQPDFKAVYLPKVMVRMRLGGASNRSLRAIVRKSAEDWDALRRSGFGLVGAARALAWKNVGKVGQFISR
jgi:glycosyltransferase involved in cell wall biosynthesis